MMLLIQIWHQLRVRKIVLIQKWFLMKLAMIKEKARKEKSHLKENTSDLHLERNHTQVDLNQNLTGHDLATHQPRKRFELQNRKQRHPLWKGSMLQSIKKKLS